MYKERLQALWRKDTLPVWLFEMSELGATLHIVPPGHLLIFRQIPYA